MDGKKSKFEYNSFWGGISYAYFCVNKDKYTLEKAKELFEIENGKPAKEIKEGSVRFGAGITEDGERFVGWWLDEFSKGTEKRRCPVWIMR